MDKNNASISSIRSNVTMVKYNAQLEDLDDPIYGSTQYLPKQKATKGTRYIRIDWTKPVEESVSIIGDKYELYRPKLKQVIRGTAQNTGNSSSAGGALAFMSMSREQLKANYEVVFVAEESLADPGKTRTAHLKLTPKAAGSYKQAELWVDADGMPRQAKITETNGDTTTVLLTNIIKNGTIDASAFTLTYDKKKVTIKDA